MMPVWPRAFMQTPKKQTWSGTPYDSRIVFTPDAGPPIFRPRVTAETWTFRGEFPLADQVEREAFWSFWEQIKNGALDFLWRDPSDGRIRRWRFAEGEPVRETAVTGLRHDISVTVIRLPSTPWWAALMPPGDLVAPRAAYDLVRGLYHNGTAQTGQTSAIGNPLAPGLVTAHGLSDVRVVLTAGGPALVLLSETLAAGWWPAGASYEDVASIAIFAEGALA